MSKLTTASLTNERTLRLSGQFCFVYPPVKDLNRHFYSVRHLAIRSPSGHEVVPAAIPMFDTGRDELLKTEYQVDYAGTAELLREWLERRGFRLKLKGRWHQRLGPPDVQRLKQMGATDDGMLSFVREFDRGLIRHCRRGRVCVARLIAQIALAWPLKRIIVVVTRIPDACLMRRQLAKYLPNVTLFSSRHESARAGRIAVATYSMLGVGSIGIERRHIYIAVNPSEIFNGKRFNDFGRLGLQHLHRARVYGMLADDARTAPALRDLITSLFGPNQVRVPEHGYHPLPVRVIFTRITGGNRPAHSKENFVIKKYGIYEHHVRNRRIVRLAQALAANNLSLLRERFPEIKPSLLTGDQRVGVLADTVPHGLALAEKLGWPLVASPTVAENGLTAQQRRLLRLGRSERRRTKEPVVVTGAGLARAGTFTVLIRADGGTGIPSIPAFKLRVIKGSKRQLLIVDFEDHQHPLLRQWSHRRRAAYRAADWRIVGEEHITALDKFLAERPEVER